MRATPTLGYSAVSHFIKQTAGRGDTVTAINLYDGVEKLQQLQLHIFNSTTSTSTAGGAIMTCENSSARLNFDAEL